MSVEVVHELLHNVRDKVGGVHAIVIVTTTVAGHFAWRYLDSGPRSDTKICRSRKVFLLQRSKGII